MIESKELNKLNKDLNNIGKDLISISSGGSGGKSIPRIITDRLYSGAEDIRGSIIKSIMQDTKSGRIYLWEAADKDDKNIIGFMTGGHGKSFAIKKRAIPHQSSAPGESPATDKGELVRSIVADQRGMEVEVGSAGGAPYAAFLEFGTPYMKARPFLGPAVTKHEKEIVNDIGQSVFEIIGGQFKGK